MKTKITIGTLFLITIFIISITGFSSPKTTETTPPLKWEPQISGTTASLRGVCAVNQKTAWASGSNSTVLRTINQGKSWSILSIPNTEKLDFRDIQAFDEETAIVISAGSPAKIYKTVNGGQSWQETYSNDHPHIFFDSMAFWDRSNGVAFSDPIDGQFFVIITDDGGTSWQRISSQRLPQPLANEAGFAASGTCMTVEGDSRAWFVTGGAVARVIYTTDKGLSWKAANTPILAGKSSQGCFSVLFKDSKNGVIVGGDYKAESHTEKNAAFTRDGGITWTLVEKNQPSGFRECAIYIPVLGDNYMITVGPSGSDYSSDGGQSWKAFGSTKGFHSMSIAPGTDSVWAVGTNGLISKLQLH